MIPLYDYIRFRAELQDGLQKACPLIKFEVLDYVHVKLDNWLFESEDPYKFDTFVVKASVIVNGEVFSFKKALSERRIVGARYKTNELFIMPDVVEAFVITEVLSSLSRAILEWRPEQGE